MNQVLDETQSLSLRLNANDSQTGSEQISTDESSMLLRSSSAARQYSNASSSGQNMYENERLPQAQEKASSNKSATKLALCEVASYRADLLLLQRRHLARLAARHEWSVDFKNISVGQRKSKEIQSTAAILTQLRSPQLQACLASCEIYEQTYSVLWRFYHYQSRY